MFQSYDVKSNPAHSGPRVAKLRAEMARLGIDGFLVPRADEHQGEYVPPSAQRLGWLTGFTGSAGVALILQENAVIFVDGRYSLQVRQQTDAQVFNYDDLVAHPPAKWLEAHGRGLTIGFVPWLHTIAGTRALREALEKAGGKLVAIDVNPIDLIWDDRPAAPLGPVSIQPLSLAGKACNDKLAELKSAIVASGATTTILTDPSSIAWTFNIRGQDVSNTPLPLSFCILPVDGKPELFIDRRKLGKDEELYLQAFCRLVEPQKFEESVRALASEPKPVLLDAQLAAEKLRLLIENAGGTIIEGADPARLPRAIKNTAELAGARNAHLRDGVALVRFFAWLDRQTPGSQDEISAAEALENFRAKTAEELGSKLEDVSFDTISGAGPDGAIIHYRVNTQSNRKLNANELYLVDSGAQYRDGTTDVTRTVAIGPAGNEERRCFTLVLKGMIGISTARFPPASRGVDIDVLARIALWKSGLDYAHGTGHGVGAFLSVHEGPQTLSRAGMQALLPGMIISNEPGYYREGAFGIRIENLLIVSPAEEIVGGEHKMLGFETLTFCPIDRKLIDVDLLTVAERDWLNTYHTMVHEKLAPYLNDEDKAWLIAATCPL